MGKGATLTTQHGAPMCSQYLWVSPTGGKEQYPFLLPPPSPRSPLLHLATLMRILPVLVHHHLKTRRRKDTGNTILQKTLTYKTKMSEDMENKKKTAVGLEAMAAPFPSTTSPVLYYLFTSSSNLLELQYTPIKQPFLTFTVTWTLGVKLIFNMYHIIHKCLKRSWY